MPNDFPHIPYKSLEGRIFAPGFDNTSIRRWEFGAAWNAVAYRFFACTEYDDGFTRSIVAYGGSASSRERYTQERELFNFFVAGLSLLESVGYGLHAVGALARPTDFPMTTEEELERITLARTGKRFKTAFPDERITTVLGRVTSDAEFKDWKRARNVLAHRAHPGRAFSMSGPVTWRLGDIPIDAHTTGSRRVWLADTVRSLLEAADAFASTHLSGT